MKKPLSVLLFGSLALFAASMSSCQKTDEPQEYSPKEYSISVTAGTGGRGEARIDGKVVTRVKEGQTVTLNATPDDDFTFSRWIVESGGVQLADQLAGSTTFVMPAQNVSLRAEFAEDTRNINVFDKIVDPGFLYYCQEIRGFDTDGDGILTLEEARAVTEINVNEWYKVMGDRIQSMAGIEYFTSLTKLTCYGNSIAEIDLSNNTELTYLHVGTNRLSNIDVTNNTKLTELYVSRNLIKEIDLSKCPELMKFQCVGCAELTCLDVSANPKLTEVYAESCPKITTLDFSHNPDMVIIRCFECSLTELNVSNCTKAEALNCFNNKLTTLDVSEFTELTVLDCSGNQLTSLDVSKATSLDYFMCYNNRMTELDATALAEPDDYYLSCGMQTVDGTTPQTLTLTLRNDQIPRWHNNLVVFDNNTGVELAGEGADIFLLIDDPVFKAYCEQFDTDQNGKLSLEEASAVTELIVPDMGITSLVGVNYFVSLRKLVCNDNQLTSLHASLPELVELVCNDNLLTELVVNKGSTSGQSLTTLSCQNNQLPKLSVAGLGKLKTLNCQNNQITELNMNWSGSLAMINCSNNKLTNLDFYFVSGLVSLTCPNNELTALNLSNQTSLTSLMCNNNPLTELDITGCTALIGVMAFECRLSELDASDMGNPDTFNLFCGNQTSDGTAAQTLTLTLSEAQKPHWQSGMKDSSLNANVILAD